MALNTNIHKIEIKGNTFYITDTVAGVEWKLALPDVRYSDDKANTVTYYDKNQVKNSKTIPFALLIDDTDTAFTDFQALTDWNDANTGKGSGGSTSVTTSVSNTLLFDNYSGTIHGTFDTPLTGDLTLDSSGSVNGATAVVIYSGSSMPNIIDADINAINGDITEQGIYSIYIHYLYGKLNINIINQTTVQPSGNYILNDNLGAKAGFSLRKLKDTAIKAVMIRRTNDDATTDVYLEDVVSITLLSTVSAGGTLGDWVGVNSATVVKWYDQTGQNNHSENLINSAQPLLVLNGVIELSNGLPALNFLGTSLLVAPMLISTNEWGIFSTVEVTDLADSQVVACQHTGNADAGRVIFDRVISIDLSNVMFFNNGTSISGLYVTDATIGQHTNSSEATADNYFYKRDMVAKTQVITGEALTPLNDNFCIGAYKSKASPFKGLIQEVIVFDSYDDARGDNIRASQETYYN